jgi:hypothetical protein
MLKKELYLSIETSLVSLGSYAFGQYNQEDLDFQVDTTINSLVNTIIPSAEDSQLKLDLLRTIKDKQKLTEDVVINNIYTYNLPTNYRNKLAVTTYTIISGKEEEIITKDISKIKLKNYYEILSEKVRLNSQWYDKGEILFPTDAITDFYGSVKKLTVLVGDVRVEPSEDIIILMNSKYNKPTLYSPVGEIIDNKISVFFPKCTPLKIETFLTYYKKIKSLYSYNLEEELELPESFLTVLVGEVVKQLQNNINN